MSDVAALLGARADFVGFGVAHFRIDFSDEARAFSMSTTADVSLTVGDLTDFRDSKALAGMIDLVGSALIAVCIDEGCRRGVLEFDSGLKLQVWWPGKPYDNLFVVREQQGDGWFVLG